jgi:hypothetical protein
MKQNYNKDTTKSPTDRPPSGNPRAVTLSPTPHLPLFHPVFYYLHENIGNDSHVKTFGDKRFGLVDLDQR